IMQETGLKSRSEKPGLLGRVSVALMSEIDQKEAEEAGACAVRSAVEGKTGFMVGFETTRNPYSSKTILIPLEKVANAEKKFPLEWIGEDGASIKPEFKAYCEPLLGAYDSRFISLR
ncbi:MAG TPA: 6-phosphofructokinase, partial [Candidatus Flavonifractor intestinigallinarum]|nr:6-phosphofructokinase [Candidatus Flavonifractor intestinigallinarum]